jgi:hypothetical protein
VVARPPADGRWPEDRVAALADTYSVSREVVLRRLLTLGLTSWSFVNEKREEYRRAYEASQLHTSTGGPSPYTLKVRDLGRPYIELALEAFHRNEITAADVSEYLEVKVNKLPQLEEKLQSRTAAAA